MMWLLLLAGCGDAPLCEASGGTWSDCGPCGPICVDGQVLNPYCFAVCVERCACPDGASWDAALGCVTEEACSSGGSG